MNIDASVVLGAMLIMMGIGLILLVIVLYGEITYCTRCHCCEDEDHHIWDDESVDDEDESGYRYSLY